MKRSFIREILENTTSKTISFAGGLPNIDMFPTKKLQESSNIVLNDANTLQYSTSTGLESLKEKIAQLYCKDGFDTKSSNIMITSGSQQALDIIARYHCNESITIEAPSYLGAMNVFTLNKLEQNSIKLNKDGCDINEFEKSIKNTKLAYLIPDFQNPTGYTYSDKKREAVANIVKQTNSIIIEDAPYSEIYFDKKYKSISSNIPNNSYHLGSFSKVLAPSLRIGWIRASEELLNPLIAYKEAMDLHTNGLSQHILNNYLEDNTEFENHKKNIRNVYSKQMRVFKTYLKDILPEFEFDDVKGGMFIYGRLPNINTSELVKKCLEQNVVFVPGVEFYNDDDIQDEIRFNFTSCKPSQIYSGLKIIKNIMNNK